MLISIDDMKFQRTCIYLAMKALTIHISIETLFSNVNDEYMMVPLAIKMCPYVRCVHAAITRIFVCDSMYETKVNIFNNFIQCIETRIVNEPFLSPLSRHL